MSVGKILFLSRTIPDCIEEEVNKKSNKTLRSAAVSLQENLISGIESNMNDVISVFNLIPVNSYPRYYSDPFVKGFNFSHTENSNDYSVGFNNIQYIKQLFLSSSYMRQFKKYWRDNKFDTVICYSASVHLFKAIRWIKQKCPKVKTCLIIPDMPEFNDMSNNQSFLKRCLYKHISKETRKYIKYFDSFVYLTEQSAEYLCDSKDYVIVEGIIPEKNHTEIDCLNKDDTTKKIVYTGTTNSQFGITTLLDAFSCIEDDEYRLIICGCGDSDELIKEKSQKDSRIDFKGMLPHKEALEIQQNATVLVNPRQNIGEYTKYSFPSKTLEYLTSGIPLIAYKLDGIPDEYDPYINYVGNNSPEALAEVIKTVCSLSYEDRRTNAQSARDFVQKRKNKIEQTKKIISMLEQLP